MHTLGKYYFILWHVRINVTTDFEFYRRMSVSIARWGDIGKNNVNFGWLAQDELSMSGFVSCFKTWSRASISSFFVWIFNVSYRIWLRKLCLNTLIWQSQWDTLIDAAEADHFDHKTYYIFDRQSIPCGTCPHTCFQIHSLVNTGNAFVLNCAAVPDAVNSWFGCVGTVIADVLDREYRPIHRAAKQTCTHSCED